MNDAAERFPYPPDEPDAVNAVRAAFRRVAEDTRGVSGKLSGDMAALAHGWGGDAANACGHEVRANQRLVTLAAGALADTDRAIEPYARAVADARHAVDGIRARYRHGLAEHEHRLRAIDTSTRSPEQRGSDRGIEAADWRGRLARLEEDHRAVLGDLSRAARRGRADLERIAERVGPPVTPSNRGNVSLAVRMAVNRTLPLQHAAAVHADAVHVVDLLGRAAAGDKAAQQALALYKLEALDPAFATEIANTLGPDGVLRLPTAMVTAMHDHPPGDRRGNAAVLGFMSGVLATATDSAKQPHVSDAWLAELSRQGRTLHHLDRPDRAYWGYWGLAQILGAAPATPPYSRHFMETTGRDVVSWIRSGATRGGPSAANPFDLTAGGLNSPGATHPGDGQRTGSESTLLSDLLHAAATSAPASQALLDHTPPGETTSNLDYLFHRDSWPDNGDTLGAAVETAAHGHDPESARVAAMAVHSYADVIRARVSHGDHGDLSIGDDPLSGARDSMGRMVAAHIDEIATTVTGDDAPHGGVWASGSRPHFGQDDLSYALLGAERDPAAYKAVLDAQIATMRLDLDHVATRPGPTSVKLNAIAARAAANGKILGFILEARSLGLEGDARAADQASGRLADYVDMGLGLITPPKHVGNIDQFNVFITDRIRTHNADDTYGQAATYWAQIDVTTRQMVESTMIQHQLWSAGGDPVTDAQNAHASFIDRSKNPPTLIAPDHMTPAQYSDFVAWESKSVDIPKVHIGAETANDTGSGIFRRLVGLPNG
jgi:uncharacterized protein YukE